MHRRAASHHPGGGKVSSQAPHAEGAARLGRARQRSTAGRRTLVELLHTAGRPLEIVELAEGPGRLPVSSIYRNLVVLEQAGAVTRYPGAGGRPAPYALDEGLGGPPPHLVCSNCGWIEDDPVPPEVDAGLASLLEAVANRTGFTVTDHRLE